MSFRLGGHGPIDDKELIRHGLVNRLERASGLVTLQPDLGIDLGWASTYAFLSSRYYRENISRKSLHTTERESGTQKKHQNWVFGPLSP